MDPYIIGLIVGAVFGGSAGVLLMGALAGGASHADAKDAARFRALAANADAVSDDESSSPVSLTELADRIRFGRVGSEAA